MIRVPLISICIGLLAAASGCRSNSLNPMMQRDTGVCGLVQTAPTNSQIPKRVANQKAKPQSSEGEVIPVSYNKQVEVDQSVDMVSQLDPAESFDSAVPSWYQSVSSSIADSAVTLEQAEAFAIANNPDLVKAMAEIESLEGKRLQVGLRPNPQVGYLSADVGEEGTAGQQGGFFSQTFIRGRKLQLNRSIVCQEINAAKQQLEINRQKLLTEVRQRFYDLLIAQERVNVANKFEQLAMDAVSLSDTLFEEEEISKIANLRSQLQAKNTSIVIQQAQNDLAAATRRFAAATGMGKPDTTEAGSIAVVGEIYPQNSVTDLDGSFSQILTESPELAQAMAELEQAKWNLNRQVAEPIRDVQVQAGFTHGNVTGDDLVALQVGVPLRINDRNQGNISSAKSDIAAKAKNIESIKRDLSKRFSVAWREYENARIQINKYQQEIIPQTTEFYELVASAYKEGEIGYLDLVSAQQAYLDASLKNLAALRDFWRAASLIDGNLLSEN